MKTVLEPLLSKLSARRRRRGKYAVIEMKLVETIQKNITPNNYQGFKQANLTSCLQKTAVVNKIGTNQN